MEAITTRKQAEQLGTEDGALEIDLYREMARAQDEEGNGLEDARKAAEQTASRLWRSDSDGEAAAVRKVPEQFRAAYCAAYAAAAIEAAKLYLEESK